MIVAGALAAIGLIVGGGMNALAQPAFGRQGEPDQAELWFVPSAAAATPSRAVLHRPPGEGPFRLAIIAHASSENPLVRATAPPPLYPELTQWLLARGFAVLIPERPGHGKTGGPYLEAQGGCESADYAGSARATADSIAAAMDFMLTQSFIRKDGAVLIGHSAGGLGALALAARNPKGVASVIAFAPGRGGRAGDKPGNVCAEDRLVAALRDLGTSARLPVTWLVARNDSYFSPDLSRRMAEAFRSGGGRVDFRELPAFGGEGHWLAEKATPAQFEDVLGRVRALRR